MTHFESVLFNVDVTLPNGADIEPNGSLPVSVEIVNNIHHWNRQHMGIYATQIPVKWDSQIICSSLCHRNGYSKYSIGSKT